MTETSAVTSPKLVGRYAVHSEIAAGGMATVHFGRLVGPVGFSKTVAIKRLHPQYAKDPEFVAMFLDEARLAARIQHPNVVSTLDVVTQDDEVFLVMEYVAGETLSKLIRAARRQNLPIPPAVAASILAGALHGLHSAHEAKSERGELLNIVHRDISPQNIMVGLDGVGKVLDFGVAKAAMRSQSTRDGQVKGKLSYMSPEQLRAQEVDRRTDIFAAAVVLWEALTSTRLFEGGDPGAVMHKLLEAPIPPPSSIVASLPSEIDAVVMRGLERDADRRYATARDFSVDLERSIQLASSREVGEWVAVVGGDALAKRAKRVEELESVSSLDVSQLSRHSVSGNEPATYPTQQSSVALAAAAREDRRRTMGVLVIAVSAAVVLGAGGVLLGISLGGSKDVRAPAAEALPTEPEPSTATASASEADAAPAASIPTVDPSELASESAAPSAAPPPVKKKTPRYVGRPKPVAKPKVKKPATNCSPPTYIDKNGIKRIKPGCM